LPDASRSSDPGPLLYVVDPNPFMVELERAILKRYRVESVAADDLFQAVASSRPAAVIAEILLPGTDGLELCRKFKAHPETSSIPFIVFSVLSAEPEALEVGADAFLLKPVDRRALLETVARLVDARTG